MAPVLIPEFIQVKPIQVTAGEGLAVDKFLF